MVFDLQLRGTIVGKLLRWGRGARCGGRACNTGMQLNITWREEDGCLAKGSVRQTAACHHGLQRNTAAR